MIAGVVLATRLPHPGMLQTLLVAGVTGIAAVVAWRGMAWRWQVILVCVVWGGSGLAAASWQLARAPASIGSGLTTDIAGVIERLDGRQDNRLRVWIRVDAADDASSLLEVPLQEDVDAESEDDGTAVTVNEAPRDGQFIRPAGLDVTAGDVVLTAGTVMSARLISLATSAGHTEVSVWRRPHIGVLSTGDELVLPGDEPARGQIISSNATYLAAFVRACGGVPVDLGIARDRAGAMLEQVRAAPVPLDMVVTTGGASVGTHDHLVSDLKGAGTELGFWKIAMRPGKPLLNGRIDDVPLLGLPGNPVSSAVCANIFLRPAIARLSGGEHHPQMIAAKLTAELRENDQRQDYLRSRLVYDESGRPTVTPARKQDSSMISIYAHADALIVRPPFDPAKSAGDEVLVMRLDPLM